MRHPLEERSIEVMPFLKQAKTDKQFIKITPWELSARGFTCQITYFNGHMPPLGAQVLVAWDKGRTHKGYQRVATMAVDDTIEELLSTVKLLHWDTQQEFLNVPQIFEKE